MGAGRLQRASIPEFMVCLLRVAGSAAPGVGAHPAGQRQDAEETVITAKPHQGRM